MLISCKLLQSLTHPFNFTHSTIYSHSLSLNYTGIIYHGSMSESIILHAFSFIHPSSKADSSQFMHYSKYTYTSSYHYKISLLISCKLLQSLTHPFNFTHSPIYSHSLSVNYTGIIYHGFNVWINYLTCSPSFTHLVNQYTYLTCKCILLHSFTHLVKLIHNNSCTILNTHIHHHIITNIIANFMQH